MKTIDELKEEFNSHIVPVGNSLIDYAKTVGYMEALTELFRIAVTTDTDKTQLCFIISEAIKQIDPEWVNPYVELPEGATPPEEIPNENEEKHDDENSED